MEDSPNSAFCQPEDLRAYLMGRLSDDDAAAIEERLFRDEAFFREMRMAEDELLDEYAAGTLPPAGSEYLLRRSQQQPELAQRIAIRKAFLRSTGGLSPVAAQHSPKRPSRVFSFSRWFLIPGLAIAVSVLIVACIFLVRTKRGLEMQLAQIEKANTFVAPRRGSPARQPEASPSPASVARLFFPAHIARGAGGQAPLRLSASRPAPIELELETPAPAPAAARWELSIRNGAGTAFSQSELRPQRMGGVSFVRAYVDPSIFAPGAYDVLLSSGSGLSAGHEMRWKLEVKK